MTYTSWNIKSKARKGRQCPADRLQHARRFSAMLRSLGLSRLDAAQMLQVSERTLHNWLSGTHQVPYAAFKLVRVLRLQEIPFKGWEGWHFSQGTLWSPEGHGFNGKDGSWWGLLVRQARMFNKLYQERQELLEQLKAAKLAITPQIPNEGLVGLGVDGFLPTETPVGRTDLAQRRARPADMSTGIEGLVTLQSSLTGEIPAVGLTRLVTRQPSPTDRTFEVKFSSDEMPDCPAPGRFARSRLARFLPEEREQ